MVCPYQSKVGRIGVWRNRLAHGIWDAGVAGSSPVTPTLRNQTARLIGGKSTVRRDSCIYIVMAEYEFKKITKIDVDFPAYCLFFLKRLIRYVPAIGGVDDKLELEITTNDKDHPYCYDAFELIVKTLERKGVMTRIPAFKREKVEGRDDILHYKFTLRRTPRYDDLPF